MKNLFYLLFNFALVIFVNTKLSSQCFADQNYTSTGTYSYTIPGITTDEYSIEISTSGADGAYYMLSGSPIFAGGEGAFMKASYIVYGGDVLTIFVGESGKRGGSPAGGGGGGGSAVIINGTDVLIAAGAGGGGGNNDIGGGGLANTNSNPMGGSGMGASGGGGFNAPGANGQVGTGGGAGTLTIIGAGGSGLPIAGDGGQGFGGGGGGAGTGGGGAGGYQGGNGGVSGALGGLGGDSYITTNYSSVVLSTVAGSTGGGVNELDGTVLIECIPVGEVLTLELLSQTNPLCQDDPSGEITVAGNGGATPYEYSLDGDTNTSGIFTNLFAGTYTLSIMDANGDTDSFIVTLTDPTAVVPSIIQVQNNVCPNESQGVIEASGTGGTTSSGNYMYSIDDGPLQSSAIFTNLPNGIYSITCYDDNDCLATITQEITSPGAVILSIIQLSNISCAGANDGNLMLLATNGFLPYSYSIDGTNYQNSGTFSDLEPGDLIIYTQDNNGCIATLNTTITEPQALEYTVDSISAGCGNDDGFIQLQAIGGTAPYSYLLNNVPSANGIYMNLATGSYSIEVTDTNNCNITGTVTISATEQLQSNISLINNISCFGGNNGIIEIQGTGGLAPYQYILNGIETNNTGQFDTLAAGQFTVEVMDQNGCSTIDTINLSQPDSLFINILITENESCPGENDGVISLEGSGGTPPYNLTINDTTSSIGIFENLSPGVYNINLTDSLDCTVSTVINIIAATTIFISNIEIEPITCYGDNSGIISFDIQGGTPNYNITFDGEIYSLEEEETFSIDSLMHGTYIFTIEDSLGCQITDSIFINQNSEVLVSIDSIYNADCLSGSLGGVNLNANGGVEPYIYILNGDTTNTGFFSELPSSNYEVMVIDAEGCENNISFNIQQTGGVVIDTMMIANVSCFGMEDGSVTIILADNSKTYTFKLNEETNTTGIFEPLAPDSYSISIKDDQGCEVVVQVDIIEPSQLIITTSIVDGTITVDVSGGTPPYQYSIDEGISFQDSPIFDNLTEGTYNILVVDTNGCLAETMVVISSIINIDNKNTNLIVYPNPSFGFIHIKLNNTSENIISYQLFNSSGKEMIITNNMNSNNDWVIDTQNFHEGVYFVVVKTNENTYVKKCIIIK